MKLLHLSVSDAVTLLEIIHESTAAQNVEQVRELLLKLREMLPYEAGIAALADVDRDGNPGEMTLVNVEYPVEYLEELWRSGIVWRDPVLLDNFEHYHLQYWGDTFQKRALFKSNKDLAEDFGFHRGAAGEGYGHGVRDRKGAHGSLFCLHGLERDPRTEEALTLVVPHLHEALMRIAGNGSATAELTARELEVLRWIAQGKSNWDIGQILSISERTVKFHISNITRKLGASTRAHAVALGFEQGLIELD